MEEITWAWIFLFFFGASLAASVLVWSCCVVGGWADERMRKSREMKQLAGKEKWDAFFNRE